MRTLSVQERRLAPFRLPLWHACCLAAFVLTICCPAFAQNTTTDVMIVDIDLARYVATEHVHENNRPYQWRYLDHMVLYDINGSPNGYAFIFGKAESGFSGPAALRQHITARTVAAPPNQGQEADFPSDKNLFAFDDLATVITGATTESPLILRHFRGAPEFWIEVVRLDTSWRAGESEAIQVLMVSPMDFRLVSTDAKAAAKVATANEAATVMSLAASAETIAVHSKKAERISALRQRVQVREAQTRKRIESMRPEQRQRHEDALQERKSFLRSQWDSKRAVWQVAGEDQP